MSSLAQRLARPEILALPPANVIAGGSEDHWHEIVRLHLNENCREPLVQGYEGARLNRYAEPQAPELRRAMASLYGVDPQCLVVTRGADDAIDILIRTFCRSGLDSIAVCKPTFAAYALFAQMQGAEIAEAELGPDFAFDADAFVAEVETIPLLKLAFICSPNNPTGTTVSPAEVLRVADALESRIVVLDEAYLEFSDLESLAREAVRRDNLVVLRTLSKAYGIAGARIGCAIANPDIVAAISRALPPFPLSSASIAVALATLSPSRRLIHAERIASVRAERDRVAALLTRSPLVKRVWPSATNFLFMEVDDPEAIKLRLGERGIRVRFRPDIVPGGIRLTIGTEEENALALAAFGVEAGTVAARRAELVRDTKETAIAVAVDLERAAPRRINTGLPFLDHMLDQVAAHGGFSLLLECEGDLEIDAHHSIEDCAIAFGEALARALGDRRGIGRFGFSLPMDEAEAHVLIDLSGRPYSRFEGAFAASHVGAYPTEMTAHVFRSLADALGAAIHVRVEGDNDHHKTEACFKAFGRALRQAIARTGNGETIPSTKGVL